MDAGMARVSRGGPCPAASRRVEAAGGGFESLSRSDAASMSGSRKEPWRTGGVVLNAGARRLKHFGVGEVRGSE